MNTIQFQVTEQVSPKNVATIDMPDLVGTVLTKAQVTEQIESKFSNIQLGENLGVINSSTPAPPSTGTFFGKVFNTGTYPNFSNLVVTESDVNQNFVFFSVKNGVATKQLSLKPSGASKLSEMQSVTDIIGNVIEGSYWYSNGNIDNASTTKRTGKIPVTVGEKIYYKNKYPDNYVNTKNIFFSEANALISTFPPSNGDWASVTVPEGSSFIALSCAIEEEFALERREPTYQQIQKSINVTEKLQTLVTDGFITGELDIEMQGGFYINNSGEKIADAAFEIGTTKVGSNVKIKVTMAKANFDAFRMLAFFKDDGTFIVGYNDLTLWTDKEFTTPEGTASLTMTKQVGFTPAFKVIQIGKLENIDGGGEAVKQDNVSNDYYELGLAFESTRDLTGYGLIFAGQSNAVGFTPYADLAAVGLPNSLNVENYDGISIKTSLTIPNGSNWGVWFSLLKRMLDAGKTPFYYNYSLGSTSLHTQWKVLLNDLSKNFANNLLSLRTLKPILKQKAVVWIQGESDAISPNDTFYYEDLKALIAYTRGVLKNPFLKWVIVGMHKNQQYFSPVVRYAQTQLAEEDDNIYFVNPDSLTWSHVGDNTHYSGAYNELLAPLIFNVIKDF